MSETTTGPHQVLGVPADATEAQLRTAYRRRIRQTHPDMGGDPADAARVNQAWSQLNDLNYQPRTSSEESVRPDDERVPDGTGESRAGYGSPTYEPSDTGTSRSESSDPGPHTGENRSGPQPSAQDTALRAAADKRIRAWWASPWAWVPAGVWLIAMVVFVFDGGADDSMVWLAAGLYATATWLPVLRRAFKLPAAALIGAVAVEVVYITPDTPMVVVLAAIIAVWVGVAIARRAHVQAIYRSLRAQYALACTFPGITGWLVLAVELGGASSRCLLENETTGRHATRSMWGRIEEGDRVALVEGDLTGLPDMVLPVEAQQKRRRRR